ncbi:DNA-directed DNA polymerase II small subunit [Halobellus clavatus]|uniref:DNA polymerase II small subunit n=1 Tax=Halobellus clavatus TaxID=660517 RepID=A0A1H3E6K9_9EURY|nr:DNA-directed DNA polymerase II small subunit [Halobellus clavatus]SDX74295.1 DNA polymerase II small subunit [Halobellus clavatus]
MPLETPVRIVRELARRGHNAEQEAVTLIASTEHPGRALETVVDRVDDETLRITAADVREALKTPADDDTAVAAPEPTSSGGGALGAETNSVGHGETNSVDREEAGDTGIGEADKNSIGEADKNSIGEAGDTDTEATPHSDGRTDETPGDDHPGSSPPVSTGMSASNRQTAEVSNESDVPVETEDSDRRDGGEPAGASAEARTEPRGRTVDPELRSLDVSGDVTGQSTGTGTYDDFVTVFRDRYEKLSAQLRGRVNHRPAQAIQSMNGGSDAAMIGLVNDIRSTKSGHWLVELEDTTGTFPCLVMKDREFADLVDELLLDECIAVEGTLSDDAGIMFVDAMYFPDVPRTYSPNTADRAVQAALVSDIHVGSEEFRADAWSRFADWLHTEEAARVEYLLIAGDMVEGVGVYPGQDEELDIVDIYEQYERFSEHLKDVPGDIEILMIPGNHDAVRLAEPQPGFDEQLREIMSAHDARITGNPSLVTVEGVKIQMYHGVSLDEVIAELPEEKASYDDPHKAMYQLLKKRHVAPQFGGKTRLAPEEMDYLVMEEVPDVFHTGHVHKLGWGKYHNVLAVNSGCWQAQTDFQKSVNIDPDVGYAPILDLDTLDMTVRKFA